jgi:hypothetical protein
MLYGAADNRQLTTANQKSALGPTGTGGLRIPSYAEASEGKRTSDAPRLPKPAH